MTQLQLECAAERERVGKLREKFSGVGIAIDKLSELVRKGIPARCGVLRKFSRILNF